MIGDGESNEGTIWEAALIASDQKLNNLIVLYDNNNSQKRCLQIKNPEKNFKVLVLAHMLLMAMILKKKK